MEDDPINSFLKIRSTLAGLVGLLTVSGCAHFFDPIDESLTCLHCELEATRTWQYVRRDYAGVEYPHHFGAGFRAGYVSVCRGGSGCPPTLPPKCYWGIWYRNEAGRAKTVEWFNGFSAGATAALNDGHRQFNQLLTAAEATGQCDCQSNVEYDLSDLQAGHAAALPRPLPVDGWADHSLPTPARSLSSGALPTFRQPITPDSGSLPSFGHSVPSPATRMVPPLPATPQLPAPPVLLPHSTPHLPPHQPEAAPGSSGSMIPPTAPPAMPDESFFGHSIDPEPNSLPPASQPAGSVAPQSPPSPLERLFQPFGATPPPTATPQAEANTPPPAAPSPRIPPGPPQTPRTIDPSRVPPPRRNPDPWSRTSRDTQSPVTAPIEPPTPDDQTYPPLEDRFLPRDSRPPDGPADNTSAAARQPARRSLYQTASQTNRTTFPAR